MVLRLTQSDEAFESAFRALLSAKREVSEDVDQVARAILDDVKERGDQALLHYSQKFDRVDLNGIGLRIDQSSIEAAKAEVDADTFAALELAAQRIKSHHERQRPKDDRYEDAIGVELGSRWTALQSVGLYVPGGTASYPSSVLMNAIPAKVAGVERVVMVVPAPDGQLNPLVLAAADLAGVDEIYRIGGAQAVAALAYGTESIEPVAKIVGPGNAFVAAAKRRVFGTVGIDMIAGPSEVLIVADGENDPDWIAIDLLAQAEHDEAAQSILITDDSSFGDAVEAAVERHLSTLSRADIARVSWQDHGAIIVVDQLDEALTLVDRIAPEHLELAFEEADSFAENVRNAGAIFVGKYTPEAVGDYVGGSNHVLPTARSARFSSGLSVMDFVKRTSILKCGPEQLRAIGPAAM
ncbi:MAG: histidinol dehydrogenase, partial [Pseudomonadota bacterium]